MRALLKLGFRYDEVMAMPEDEAKAFVMAHQDIISPQKKTYLVKRTNG